MGGPHKPVKQVGQRAAALFLEESGWTKTRGGWKHPSLHFVWPLWAAVRAQREVDAGKWSL